MVSLKVVGVGGRNMETGPQALQSSRPGSTAGLRREGSRVSFLFTVCPPRGQRTVAGTTGVFTDSDSVFLTPPGVVF